MKCVFFGYAAHQKGYRCYHPSTQKMFITLDVVFHEDSMYFSSESKLQGEYQEEVQTLNSDIYISTDIPSGNQDVGNLDTSGINLMITHKLGQ